MCVRVCGYTAAVSRCKHCLIAGNQTYSGYYGNYGNQSQKSGLMRSDINMAGAIKYTVYFVCVKQKSCVHH